MPGMSLFPVLTLTSREARSRLFERFHFYFCHLLTGPLRRAMARRTYVARQSTVPVL